MNTNRKKYVDCPCGELIEGSTDDALVEATQEHLTNEHPGLDYSREQILMFAY